MIQDQEVSGTDPNEPEGGEGDVSTDNAEFESSWDQLDEQESGQPSDADGRSDDQLDDADEDDDDAGQATDRSGTPDADASASRGETSDDIWASAPQPLREAYEREVAGRKQAENLVRANGGRLAQALNQLSTLEKQLSSQRDANAGEGGDDAKTKAERLANLREEYPDVAGPILEQLDALRSTVDELKAGQRSSTETELQTLQAEQATALRTRHTDFDAVVNSTEYATWLEGQPDAIKRIIADNAQKIVNADDCAFVLDRFKEHQSKAQAEADRVAGKRRRQLDAGTGVGGRQPPVTRDEEGGFEDEWDRLDRIEARKAGGRR